MKSFMCKAILNKADTSNTGVDWATALRTRLKVHSDSFEVSNSKIMFSDIKTADIRIVPSAFFVPSAILSISLENGTVHHFGLVYSKYWKNDLPFSVNRNEVKVPLIGVRRAIILSLIGWLLWENLISKFL